jgi:hypothetical protein
MELIKDYSSKENPINIPLDTANIKDVKSEERDILSFRYEMLDFQTKIPFPIEGKGLFVVKLGTENLFVSAVLYLTAPEVQPTKEQFGLVQCDVKLQPFEEERLLLFLARHFNNRAV